jgi:hypothetical protein
VAVCAEDDEGRTACDWFKMELTQSGLFMAHCSFRS